MRSSLALGLVLCLLGLCAVSCESRALAQADPPAGGLASAVGRYQLLNGQVDGMFLGQRVQMYTLVKFDTATGLAWQLDFVEREGDILAKWLPLGEP
jgi:hypothetical protein